MLLLNQRQLLFYNESGAAITQSVLVRSVDVFAVLRFVFPVMEFLLVWILNINGIIRKRTSCEIIICLMHRIKFYKG